MLLVGRGKGFARGTCPLLKPPANQSNERRGSQARSESRLFLLTIKTVPAREKRKEIEDWNTEKKRRGVTDGKSQFQRCPVRRSRKVKEKVLEKLRKPRETAGAEAEARRAEGIHSWGDSVANKDTAFGRGPMVGAVRGRHAE